MPGGLAGTAEVMRFLAEELSPDTYVNVMDQYGPAGKVLELTERYHDIARRVTPREVAEAVELARAAGLWRLDERWRPLSMRAVFRL